MKKILLFLLISIGTIAQENADQITYNWLVKLGEETGYTDHVQVFKQIFKKMKVKNFLEFGLGYSTKYFLDSCGKVISVEFVTQGSGPEWILKCMKLFEEYPNWIPIVFFTGYQGDTTWAPFKYVGSQSVYQAASYQAAHQKSYAEQFDDFYRVELNAFVNNLMKYRSIDVALVDCGLLIHGDLVQILFGKVPVIVAHDTNSSRTSSTNDPYGYTRIVVSENYEEIYLPVGVGCTVWILKKDEYQNVTEELKKYAKSV